MPDVRALRSSLAAFAGEVGRPLTGWQVRALELERRITAIVAPRQSGKSRSLAVLGLWRAFREPGHRVLIVSAGEEAARRLLAEVRSVAFGSPLLADSVIDDLAGLVTLTNGSEVRSVPASARQIRGWSVDTLLVDEAALVADELLLDAAMPTTAARPEARVVMASSATVASGAFFDHAVRGEAGSEHVRTFRWALSDAEWISPSVIEAARESMSELRFAAEYEGRFASGADALFTREALDRVTADYLPDELGRLEGPARVVAGVDWGATTDRSAVVAIGRLAGPERRFAVRCAYRWPAGHPLSAVTAEIAASPAHIDTVCLETNGLGLPVAQELRDRLRRRDAQAGGAPLRRAQVWDLADLDDWSDRRRRRAPIRLPGQAPPFASRVVFAHTTAEMKAAAYSALRLLVDHGRLLLPASAEDLLRELLLLRVDLTPSGTERIEAKGSAVDDLADALMLGAVPYRGRDRRWRCWLAELANPRAPLPAPNLDGVELERLERVATAGGIEVPRTPVWVSVRGPEVTAPATARREDPVATYWARREAARRRVSAANRGETTTTRRSM
jgi:hypothetical protein